LQFDITAKKYATAVNDHEIMNLFLLILFISTCNAFQAQAQGLLLQEKNKSFKVMAKHQTFKKCAIFLLYEFFSSHARETKYFLNFPDLAGS